MPRLKPPPGRNASARVAEVPEDETTNVLATPQDDNEIVTEDNLSEEEDASVAFQKQIEALKKSEQAAKDRAEQAVREREEAIKRAKDREAEVNKLRKETVESQVNEVASALAAAQAEADAAQRDIALAAEAGDFQAQSIAYRRLAKAETAIARLEDGKAELEERAKAPSAPEPVTQDDLVEKSGLPFRAKEWLRQHPEYLTNNRKNAQIQAMHWTVVDEGHEPYSQEYFESLETHLGMRQSAAQQNDVEEDVQPTRRASAVVSAPVSRETPSSSGNGDRPGRITLSAAQKEAAKIAGISEAEYAKNVIRLRNEKANGNYTGGQ